MDNVRKEFQDWAHKQGLDVDHVCVSGHFKCYCATDTQRAFEIWMESRAVICVELPEFEIHPSGDFASIDAAIACLDSAGVSYK